jgi:glycosyltransferase involved in cell wall biosynthesis
MAPKVSIILPVYQPNRYLQYAINSILNQSYRNFELIVIDDGSDNDIKDFFDISIDNRINFIKKKHTGIVDTLNIGINKATGELIARMDSDDISHPLRLEKQIKFLSNNKEIKALGTNFFIIDEKWTILFRQSNSKNYHDGFNLAYLNSPILHPTLMIYSSIFEKIGVYDKKYELIEDYEIFNRILINGYKIANLDEYLFYYRIYQNRLNAFKELYQKKMIYYNSYNYINLYGKIDNHKIDVIKSKMLIQYYFGTNKRFITYLFAKKKCNITLILRYIHRIILPNIILNYLFRIDFFRRVSFTVKKIIYVLHK